MHAHILAVALLVLPQLDNPVLVAAKKRQDAVKSIEVVCVVTEVQEPFSDFDAKGPAVRTVNTWRERIVFDGDRSRTEVWRFHSGPTEWWTVETCDGKLVKSVSGPSDRTEPQFIRASIAAAGDTREILPRMGGTYHLPLILAVRAVSQPVEWSKRPAHLLHLSPQKNELTGQQSQWPVFLSSAPRLREVRLWADPKQDHAIRLIRWHSEPRAPFGYQTEVEYARHDPSELWLPKRWEEARYGEDDNPTRSTTVRVEKVTLNADWPDSEFDIALPPGTRVSDERDGAAYFVEKDGTLRPFQVGVDDVEPIPPFFVVIGWLRRNWGWLGVALILVAVLLWKVVVKRLFRSRE